MSLSARWYLIIPLGVIAFFSFVTWHIALFGLCILSMALTWEIADNHQYRAKFDEIERYANDGNDDGH
jgi:hypothetical protein